MIKASIGQWDFYEIRSWVLLMKSLGYSREEVEKLIQDSHIHLKDWKDVPVLKPGQLLKLGLPLSNLKHLLFFHKSNEKGKELIDWIYEPKYYTSILIVGVNLYTKIRGLNQDRICRLFPQQYKFDPVENIITLNIYADKE